MEEKVANSFRILSLYRTDYSASIHVRAMAKLISTSHVTLLPHLKRLEQLKILYSEKTGKNKEYRLNKDNILTKHYLTITEELTTINYLEKNFLMKKLAEHLASTDTASPLILFGSYTKDYATEESDIDLFCIGKTPQNQINHIKKFESTFGKKINIETATTENFNTALRTGDSLIKEIIKNHIILQNADPFVTMLWRYYVER
ncbi:MAG TPA: nucleotidyltransferase domain-containing protein [Candidatus Bathyarchaeia archaeon]